MREEKIKQLKEYIDKLKTNQLNKVDKKSNFVNIEKYDCYLNNGKIISREKITKAGSDGNAAIVLPITKDNNVIVVVEPRVFSTFSVGVGLPAGYVEENETYEQAAIRELAEEIGYRPAKMISLGSHYQDTGCSAALNECFIAVDCTKTENQKLDDGEYIEYMEFTLDEVYELINMGYIKDANTVITLLKAKEYVKGR